MSAATTPSREEVARIVYAAMWEAANYSGTPEPKDQQWQDNGNSFAQSDARKAADAILALFTPAAESAGLREARAALRLAGDQFAFYAREHRAAGKFDKAETNQRYANLCLGVRATTEASPPSATAAADRETTDE